MAKVCVYCDSFSVYILIFLTSLVPYTIQDEFSKKDIHFYHLDGAPLVSEIEFNLLDLKHVQKRETDLHNSTVSPSISIESTLNDTDMAVLDPTYRRTSNAMNKPILPLPTNFRKPMPLTFYRRNLGENGTGIWTTSTTIGPPLIPIPVKPLTVDANAVMQENCTSDIDLNNDLEKMFDTSKASFDKYVEENHIEFNKSDNHLYYNSTRVASQDIGRAMWVDFSNSSLAMTHDLLSMSHRRAATVKLSFEFPFYGHLIRNVTVATGGFIYTGEYVHSWLAATQYIAPLMANFDTSLSNDSFVKYIDNSTAFTVQWERVALQEKPDDGQFTFQTTLHKNGDIVFAYKNVPDIIKTIEDVYHPVTVGLSDAYIVDHSEDYVRRKTIFEYHKVSFKKEDIKNWTVIYLTALPTCLAFTDCHSCVTSDIPSFKCSWCPSTKKCSVGVDRFRHDWIMKGCDRKQIRNIEVCETVYNSDLSYNEVFVNGQSAISSTAFASRSMNVKSVQMGVSGVIAALFLGALVVAMGMWIIYAYRNPHTTSGQILIRYRPSQWRWRRGEARYTAATIHM